MPQYGAAAFLPIFLVSVAAFLALRNHQISRYIVVLFIFGVALAIGGVLNMTIPSVFLAAYLLAKRSLSNSRALLLLIVSLQLSYMATIEAWVAPIFSLWGMEASTLTLIALTGLALITKRKTLQIFIVCLATVCVVFLVRSLNLHPGYELSLTAIPTIFLVMRLAGSNVQYYYSRSVALAVVLTLSWLATPPRFFLVGEIAVVLPNHQEGEEAIHFTGLTSALRYTGLRVINENDIETIGDDQVVVMPWLSAVLDKNEDEFIERFRILANQRRWTVVLFGEHNGLGDSDIRAKRLSNMRLFNRDLTVPPENADVSGPLFVTDTRAWPSWAILNRGASTRLSSLRSRILLAGEGWWAEPDIGEWLWIGDFRWRPGDRGGRLSLAHATIDPEGATWVAVGDTSPVLTRQLIADPRPFFRLLDLASLMPVLLRDLLLSGLYICLLLHFSKKDNVIFLIGSGLCTFNFIMILVLATLSPLRYESRGLWRDHYLGEGGFAPNNFAASLALEPKLLDSGWRFKRFPNPQHGYLTMPDYSHVAFFLIEGEVILGDVRISNCWRLGDVPLQDHGVRLIDAQVCKVDGRAEILIGEQGAAVAIRVRGPLGSIIIIFDQGFLATNSPRENAIWLSRTISETQNFESR
jgi:hypothetical protein